MIGPVPVRDHSSPVLFSSHQPNLTVEHYSHYSPRQISPQHQQLDSQLAKQYLLSTYLSTDLPQGQYFISPNGHLYQPYRLYADEEGAFTQPLGTFDAALGRSVCCSSSHSTWYCCSRNCRTLSLVLHQFKTASKPLADAWTGIKEIYDIVGVRTSDGNRAFYDL